jgi:hypothetical protein
LFSEGEEAIDLNDLMKVIILERRRVEESSETESRDSDNKGSENDRAE